MMCWNPSITQVNMIDIQSCNHSIGSCLRECCELNYNKILRGEFLGSWNVRCGERIAKGEGMIPEESLVTARVLGNSWKSDILDCRFSETDLVYWRDLIRS